jgi:hypothetical protein
MPVIPARADKALNLLFKSIIMEEKIQYKNKFWEYFCPFVEHMAMGLGTILYSGSLEGGVDLSGKTSDYFVKKGIKMPMQPKLPLKFKK